MEKNEPIHADTTGLPPNGHSRAAQLSSNTTLLWRVFLPVFGTVFFTGLLLAFMLVDEEELYLMFPILWVRIAVFSLWIGWLFFIRNALWPLKRVDADDAHVFVTNYWTTVRYPWTDVDQLEEKKFWGRRAIALRLKAPGRFGQEILFLPGSHYQEWMEANKKQHLSTSS